MFLKPEFFVGLPHTAAASTGWCQNRQKGSLLPCRWLDRTAKSWAMRNHQIQPKLKCAKHVDAHAHAYVAKPGGFLGSLPMQHKRAKMIESIVNKNEHGPLIDHCLKLFVFALRSFGQTHPTPETEHPYHLSFYLQLSKVFNVKGFTSGVWNYSTGFKGRVAILHPSSHIMIATYTITDLPRLKLHVLTRTLRFTLFAVP